MDNNPIISLADHRARRSAPIQEINTEHDRYLTEIYISGAYHGDDFGFYSRLEKEMQANDPPRALMRGEIDDFFAFAILGDLHYVDDPDAPAVSRWRRVKEWIGDKRRALGHWIAGE